VRETSSYRKEAQKANKNQKNKKNGKKVRGGFFFPFLFLPDSISLFHEIILATGSRAIVPPIPGVDLEGVFTVRASQDAINIRE
jgi:hypothetical protein